MSYDTSDSTGSIADLGARLAVILAFAIGVFVAIMATFIVIRPTGLEFSIVVISLLAGAINYATLAGIRRVRA